MSAALWHLFGLTYPMSRQVEVPDYNSTMLASTVAIQRLPTEPVGSFSLTLNNLVAGSSIQIETQAGAAIENRTAGASSELFSIPTFGGAAPADQLRIKVRKGSTAPYFVPYETLATAFLGAQSIFVSQIPDE